ncbi:adenylate/guanylate cyclase domain-containing protein [Limnobacter humi]|uniref:Adenylate/guanylate cyclase domain-containing protein n=1 Tax=Limnobacter humi TaxID=1778671 RepID=A0ABT1WFI6_9BURK|nr:adenylate/guanylate cyclase domain-containing protein [Limnobacter humi]MCQ8896282.1 adenylate/guanylate cyclase domain-containing protein [Limnobacter humi]
MMAKHWQRWLGKGFRILVGFSFTGIAVLNVLGLAHSEIVQRLDHLIYDVRLRTTAAQVELDPRIIIVDIDENSLSQVGRWPWSRDVLSQLVVELTDHLQAAVVGFDVVFAEPQSSDAAQALSEAAALNPALKPALDKIQPALAQAFDRDSQFAQTIASRPVVLGYYLNQNAQATYGALPPVLFKRAQLGSLALDSTQWQGYGGNIPVLQKKAGGGFFNPMIDEDGTVRSIPLVAQYQDGYYQSLALATLRRALGNPQVIPVFPEGVPDDYGAVELLALRSDQVSLDIPVERGLISRVNFRGKGGPSGGAYQYVSAADVLGGKFKPEQFEGRIVLVGTTAPGLLDLRSTPVNPAYPGVEVHANVLSSMLDGDYKLKPEFSQGLVLVSVLVVGLTLSLLMPILNPVWSLVTALVVLSGAIAVNFALYFQASLVLPVAVVLLLVLAIFMFDVAYGYLAESRSKRQMVNLFGEYVAPELVTEMAADPSRYSMEGESRELTVLFSDVRGFTSISESLEPNELREYINEYLTTMSEIIRAHRGTLDKYIGDAIMAFWGAPVSDVDHATLATQAAVAMQEEAIKLNARFKARNWPTFSIGVGVNTGVMRVGDMGSKIRRAYTVMGDAVNLGSRLEGITKTYGAGVIVGPQTRQAVASWVFQELDAVRVKGKLEPVAIYAPVAVKAGMTATEQARLDQWHALLTAFRAQEWDKAEQILQQLVDEHGDSTLYTLYRDRIQHFRSNPPGSHWDGVTTFDTK